MNNRLVSSQQYIIGYQDKRRIVPTFWSVVRGVYPVMRKWSLGVGISDAIKPIKSLFIYPGYLNVVVLVDIIVET